MRLSGVSRSWDSPKRPEIQQQYMHKNLPAASMGFTSVMAAAKKRRMNENILLDTIVSMLVVAGIMVIGGDGMVAGWVWRRCSLARRSSLGFTDFSSIDSGTLSAGVYKGAGLTTTRKFTLCDHHEKQGSLQKARRHIN